MSPDEKPGLYERPMCPPEEYARIVREKAESPRAGVVVRLLGDAHRAHVVGARLSWRARAHLLWEWTRYHYAFARRDGESVLTAACYALDEALLMARWLSGERAP